MIQDLLRFLLYNVRHYALALWGFRLRFDPPYPKLTKFFPKFIGEPVLEYRTYGLTAFWAVLLVSWFPPIVLLILIGFWATVSSGRSEHLRTSVQFWRQVVRENGLKHMRGHGRLMEALILEQEHRIKTGGNWQELALEASRLQEEVILANPSEDAQKRILAGF